MTSFPYARLLVAACALLGAALISCGGKTTAATVARGTYADPCSLLTLDDAAFVAGHQMQLLPDVRVPGVAPGCGYEADPNTDVPGIVSLTLVVRLTPGVSPDAAFQTTLERLAPSDAPVRSRVVVSAIGDKATALLGLLTANQSALVVQTHAGVLALTILDVAANSGTPANSEMLSYLERAGRRVMERVP